MKTKFTLIAWLISCCAMLFNLPANAQFTHFPTYNAPIHGKAPVDHGLLQDLDQKTSPIWFKVNGNIAGSQPHNKMHPFVTPGSQVQVNFNINKNTDNRYTLVTYTVSDLGVRKMYDYHSDHFNLIPPSPPVQGNSNQQLVLVPTCRFEIYFVKGALSLGWDGPAPDPNVVYDPATDPNNPYTNDLGGVIPDIPAGLDQRIIDFAYGGTGECDDCPFVLVPEPNLNPYPNCVYPRLLEVIDLPATQEKELLFSVANTINTDANGCGTLWPEIGDIIFTNLFPSHTGNNQPYFFRWNYQLGPNIPNYNLPPTMPPQSSNPVYQGAFVFDQRNNHNNWDYNVYQSDIVRYKVTYDEYDRLNTPGLTPKPQICIELSPKHPEPHTSLEPIYCFDIVFECELEEPCTEIESTSGNFIAQIPVEFENGPDGNFDVPVRIINTSTDPVTAISVTLGPNPRPILAPTTGPYVNNFSWNAVNDGISNVSFSAVNTAGFVDGAAEDFEFTISMDDLINLSGGVLSIAVTAGGVTETLDLEAAICAIIVPLPVELLTFTGAPSSDGINLKWNTASEKNNDRFEVERSADGINFEKIGTVRGKGTTSAVSDYSLLDKRPLQGLNYYRLKQVDFDGAHEFSQIIKVNSEKGAVSLGVQLIPNPCSDQNCSVLLQGVDASKAVVVEMKDLTGRVVFSQQVASDQASFNLPKANLGKGIYILSAKNGAHITYQKVIIQ